MIENQRQILPPDFFIKPVHSDYVSAIQGHRTIIISPDRSCTITEREKEREKERNREREREDNMQSSMAR
jgi:hypothetical protein